MRISEIEKEGFVKFEEQDKSREVSKEEYDQLIENAYISQLKYKNGKVDSKLRKKYEKLKNRTKKLKNIKNIYFIENARLERRNVCNTFLAAEDSNGPCLLYNISTGEDHSFDFNRALVINKGKTVITKLYTYNGEDIQDEINIGYMSSIKLFKNANIINDISGAIINDSDFIEFSDRLGNKIYLDILFNNIFARRNSYNLVKNNKTKEIDIYKYNEELNIKSKIFKNMKFHILSMFCDFE